MNKSKTKEIVSKNSILTPDWLLVKHNDQLESVGNLGFPLVVKPNDQGSNNRPFHCRFKIAIIRSVQSS